MSTHTYSRHLVAALVVAAPLLAAAPASAQVPVTFSATASVKGPSGSGSRPVTIRIDKFVSDADRDAVIAVIKAKKPGETLKALTAKPDIGYVEVGDKRTPIKYAYARSTGDGRLITFVTAQPLAYLDPGSSSMIVQIAMQRAPSRSPARRGRDRAATVRLRRRATVARSGPQATRPSKASTPTRS